MAYREEFQQGAGSASETARDGKTVQPPQAEQKLPEIAPPAKKRGLGKKPVILAVLAAALAFGAYEGHEWWTDGRFMVSTDDAYVQADITLLSAKISGYVASVAVTNNQSVKAGDLIAKIDDGDYRLALQSAKDKLATQQSAIARIGRQIEAGRASVAQAEAQVVSAQAEAERAESDYARQQQLAKSDYTSKASLRERQGRPRPGQCRGEERPGRDNRRPGECAGPGRTAERGASVWRTSTGPPWTRQSAISPSRKSARPSTASSATRRWRSEPMCSPAPALRRWCR